MTKLIPKYTLWESVKIAIEISMKALQEIRDIKLIPGPAGKDGLGLDDFDVIENEEGFFLRLSRGDEVKQKRLPIVRDTGIWRERTYDKGDGVSWNGCFWIAQEKTTDKPQASKSWRLAVKSGRDGKDYRPSENSPPTPVKLR